MNSRTGAISLSKSDVKLSLVDNVRQYSSSNPPPYPVTSVNGKTGAVTISVPATRYMHYFSGEYAASTSTIDQIAIYFAIPSTTTPGSVSSNVKSFLQTACDSGSIYYPASGFVVSSSGTSSQAYWVVQAITFGTDVRVKAVQTVKGTVGGFRQLKGITASNFTWTHSDQIC